MKVHYCYLVEEEITSIKTWSLKMNKKYKTIVIETYFLLLSTYTGTKWLSKINVVV